MKPLKRLLQLMPVYQLSVCCIIKDENEYLDEWMTYHTKLGVQRFYIYDNGSKVPVSQTLQQINKSNYATVTVMPGIRMQYNAYQHCLETYGHKSRWMAFIDIDEFITPNTTNNLVAFLKDYKRYGGLGINWLIFGSGGQTRRTGKPVLESFTKRSEPGFHINKHIKSIVQPRFVVNIRDPHSVNYKKGKHCVNENFEAIEWAFSEASVTKIQLNHYYCRTLEEYQEKIARGLADTGRERLISEFYHHDDESNKIEDTRALELMHG